MSEPYESVGVVGAGAWGTALAQVVSGRGRAAILWAREPEIVEAIRTSRENPRFLPGIRLHPGILATGDLAEAARAAAILLVPPAQHLRGVCTRLAPLLPAGRPLVVGAKGIEAESSALMSEVVAEVLPRAEVAVLSGPTFAREVAMGLPAAATLAARRRELGERLVATLATPTFRLYLSDDPAGVEIGGAAKNVLAIACGIVEGRGLGENARAALIARGLSEILDLAVAKGADPRTLMGLSGLGDVCLTCTSATSRNTSLGIALGRGESLAEILAARHSVTEGVDTARAVVALARRLGVEMPISSAIDAVLGGRLSIDEAIEGLLSRPVTREVREALPG